MEEECLGTMIAAIQSGGVKTMVRVAAYNDRAGMQQALDLGADGILVPYINTAQEAREAISCCKYPMEGTRSVYFPQRSTNKKGLLGYVGNANKNVIIALQVETHDCIKNMDEIAAVEGYDMLFLGQNDLCMSMGLYEKYKFPDMYTSVELGQATDKLISAAKANGKILGIFLFGTDRVGEFIKKGFVFFSVGNDLHHIMTQADAHLKKVKSLDLSASSSSSSAPKADAGRAQQGGNAGDDNNAIMGIVGSVAAVLLVAYMVKKFLDKN